MGRNHKGKAILVVLLLGLLSGCRSKPARTNGLVPITLQTDWYPQPEMGGFYEAQQKGLYQAAGLDVTITPGGPMVIVQQVVASGAAQFAMDSSDHVLEGVSHDLPVVAVAATMQQDPQAVMVHESSPVRTFADLEGRTIAVRPGSTWFEYLLKRYNLHNVREVPATYTVASFLHDPDYIQQCFVTSEPFFASKAGAQVRTLLISSSGYQPYRVIFTSKQFLAQHPEIVAKFVQASMEGWKQYLDDPATVNTELAKLNPAMSPDQAQFSVETLKADHFVEGDGSADSHLGHFTAERWASTYKQLLDLKVLAKPFDPATAYTLQFAP